MSPKNQKDPTFSAQPEAAFKTDIVDNIPLHQAAPPPAGEAENIDVIMQDVSKEVKKVDQAPPKHHWLGHKGKPKPESKPQAPVALAAPPPPTNAHGPVPRQSAPPASPKPKNPASAPVMAIIFAMIITAFLIVAAIAAYKK